MCVLCVYVCVFFVSCVCRVFVYVSCMCRVCVVCVSCVSCVVCVLCVCVCVCVCVCLAYVSCPCVLCVFVAPCVFCACVCYVCGGIINFPLTLSSLLQRCSTHVLHTIHFADLVCQECILPHQRFCEDRR